MNKFELTDEVHPCISKLRRIRALRDIPSAGVKAGDLGGWVASVDNLAQDGDAWVGGDAWVVDRAWVSDRARVGGDARVGDHARVGGDAWVVDPDDLLAAGPLSSEGHYGRMIRQAGGGYVITIGCWDGSIAGLRELARSDEWPSGCDQQTREIYRPRLLAYADLCEAQLPLLAGVRVGDGS